MTLMTPVYFYLMIGFAHWTAHILQCSECKTIVIANTKFILEGVTHTCGWPIAMMNYLLRYFAPRDSMENLVEERFRNIVSKSGGAFIDLKQEDGESDSAFKERIAAVIGKVVEKRREELDQ